MKEDYLWDRSGEPDPEIQELERVLGALRYQPRPLEIPAVMLPQRNRIFTPRLLAIAATIAIMLLGAGLWFGLQTTPTNKVAEVENKPPITDGGREAVVAQPPEGSRKPVEASTDPKHKTIHHRVNPGSISHQLAMNRRPKLNAPGLSPNEREEAEAAKAQLMLALRVASSKLSFAQKKAQEINSDNQTRNQHKVG